MRLQTAKSTINCVVLSLGFMPKMSPIRLSFEKYAAIAAPKFANLGRFAF